MENLIVRALQNNFTKRSESKFDSQDLTGGFVDFFGGVSRSGKAVTPSAALSLSAVYNAIDQISNDLAKLPKHVFKKIDGSREKFPEHPVDYLIGTRPNPISTQSAFTKSLMINALMFGNGIAVIEENKSTGVPVAFHLVKQEDILSIKKTRNSIRYDIRGWGVLSHEDVIHITGFSFDGVIGVSVFRYAAGNLGASLSAETFADENFKAKGMLAGLITTKKQLSGTAKSGLANAMEKRLSKGDTHNIGVLDEEMGFMPIASNASEASLIDWKKISIEDVARWFNIAPHKIKHLANSTYSNIEQQSLEHGADTIAPWVKKIEEEYNYKLFPKTDIGVVYVKFNMNALIRTDIKTKGEYYSRAVNFGWKTRNEIRILEDDNILDGLDSPLQPANTLTIEQIEKQEKDEK